MSPVTYIQIYIHIVNVYMWIVYMYIRINYLSGNFKNSQKIRQYVTALEIKKIANCMMRS